MTSNLGSDEKSLDEIRQRLRAAVSEWLGSDAAADGHDDHEDWLSMTAAAERATCLEDAIRLLEEWGMEQNALQAIRTFLEHSLEEWLGFDLPEEGDDDYLAWQSREADIESIESLKDAINILDAWGIDPIAWTFDRLES